MIAAQYLEQLGDLEQLVRPYARVPDQQEWVPLSLFMPTGDPVVISLVPAGRGKVRVTDDGDLLAKFRDLGLSLRPDTKLLRDVSMLAKRFGYRLVDGTISRVVSVEEVPPAILNLAEAELSIAGRLYSDLYAEHELQFRVIARRELQRDLTNSAKRHVHFDLDYAAKYHDGEFFCFVEAKKPLGVKLVTNKQNMLDALVVHHLYEQDPIQLSALKKPDAQLGGRRVVNFESTFAGHIFERVSELAESINRIAG